MVSRDRAGVYAEGATLGAPGAGQVADRFHLLRNLTEAVQRALERLGRAVRAAVMPLERPAPAPSRRGGPVARREPQLRVRRRARYEQVVALKAQGLTHVAIWRRTGVSRHTIIRWLAGGHFPERRDRASRPTLITPYTPYLRQRWADGCRDSSRLWRELREHRGFRGSRTTAAERVLTRLRSGAPRVPNAALPRTAHPSHRRAAWLWCKAYAALTAPERAYVGAVCAAAPPLAQVRRLAADFRDSLAAGDVAAVGPWLAKAQTGELRPLALSVWRDRNAVEAAAALPWSNGQIEGQVNRLKLVKRTTYGRAGFALLRRRVLAA